MLDVLSLKKISVHFGLQEIYLTGYQFNLINLCINIYGIFNEKFHGAIFIFTLKNFMLQILYFLFLKYQYI